MSRTPASYSLPVVRGATWEDFFIYEDPDGAPVDLTGYSARMQVRTVAGQYGLTTAATLLLELSTTNGLLIWNDAVDGKLDIVVAPADHAALNPLNLKKMAYVYSVELFVPEDTDPEYVIPLVKGKIIVQGETTR
jgi:hypothetical protein